MSNNELKPSKRKSSTNAGTAISWVTICGVGEEMMKKTQSCVGCAV